MHDLVNQEHAVVSESNPSPSNFNVGNLRLLQMSVIRARTLFDQFGGAINIKIQGWQGWLAEEN